MPKLNFEKKCGDYFFALASTIVPTEPTKTDSIDQLPPDQSLPAVVCSEIATENPAIHAGRKIQDVKPILARRSVNRRMRSTSRTDSSSTEDSDDANGTVIEVSRPKRRVAKLANASTSSTSTS